MAIAPDDRGITPTCRARCASNLKTEISMANDWKLIEPAAACRSGSGRHATGWRSGVITLCLCLSTAAGAFCQKPTAPATKPPAPTQPESSPPADDQPLPGDWGPELLYSVLSSPNQEAQLGLLRATFAAGPAIIPQLAEALKDDRTAEYAAQSLAYIGGEQSLPLLWKLLTDPRDLNLRRFTYGALAEYNSPQATDMLFDVIDKSDAEPDRTVTEAALIALTVRTDPQVMMRLQASEKKLQDVVIRDDMENARAVIAERSKYLGSPAGRQSGGSIEAAVRTYFIPALQSAPATTVSTAAATKSGPGKPLIPRAPAPPPPAVSVSVRNITFSPDKERALARVVFQDPSAIAYYDFVLQKRAGNWTLASVWLGPEVEKTPATAKQPEQDTKDSDTESQH
jgi:hypothetical protein